MLQKFEMDKAKVVKTSMPTNGQLGLGEIDKVVDQKGTHRSIFGSLLYRCISRLGIMVSIGLYARFFHSNFFCLIKLFHFRAFHLLI